MLDIYKNILLRTLLKPRIAIQTGQPDRLCGGKTPLSRLLSNLMIAYMSAYVKGHTDIEPFNYTRKIKKNFLQLYLLF